MPQKKQEAKPCKAAPTGALAKELPQLVVVGTYKEKQLAWMKRHGVYNYPVRAGDKFDDAALKQVREVWLYADAQGTRHAFRATFEETMSAEAFRARHPSYAKLGPSRHQAYYVFKVESLDYGSALEMPLGRGTVAFGRGGAPSIKFIVKCRGRNAKAQGHLSD